MHTAIRLHEKLSIKVPLMEDGLDIRFESKKIQCECRINGMYLYRKDYTLLCNVLSK